MVTRVSQNSQPYPSPSKSVADEHIPSAGIEEPSCSAEDLQSVDFDSGGSENAAQSELLDRTADETSESQIEYPHQDSAEPSALASPVGQDLLAERSYIPSELTQLSPRLNRSDKGRLR
jgi:hypothetical protein